MKPTKATSVPGAKKISIMESFFKQKEESSSDVPTNGG